jgi:hypothetical protein
MVAIRVIRCGYNYSSMRLVIHHGAFRSFATLHHQLGRLACDGQLSISRVIYSKKSRIETMHNDSSFVVPNTWIMDTENIDDTIFIWLWMVNPNGVT